MKRLSPENGRDDGVAEGEARFRSFYNRSPVMMQSIDQEGILLSVNDYWLSVMGYRREEVLGRPVTDFLTEPSRRYAREVGIPRLIRTGHVQDVRLGWIKKNGETIDVMLSSIANFDADGRMSHSFAIAVDVTRQVRAEAALRANEERLRRIFNFSNDAGFLLDAVQDRILDVNSRACSLLGYARGELLALVATDAFRGAETSVTDFFRVVMAEGSGATDQLMCRQRNGQEVAVEISASRVEIDSEDRIVAWVRDITERKRAEELLRRSEVRFRRLVEHAEDMFLLVGENNEFLDVNDAACRTLGYTRDELLQMTVTDVNAVVTPEELRSIFERLERGKALAFDAAHRRKDGSVFPTEVRVTTFDEAGRKLRLALVRDVTERRRVEEKLRESEARFRRLVENATDMFILAGADATILDVNESACAQLGYSREEIIGLSIPDIAVDLSQELVRTYFQAARPNRPLTVQARHRRKDGSQFPAEVRVTTFEESGRRLHLALVRDMTERAAAEQALKERTEELESFSYSISHDLRTPLRAIDGFSRILEEDHARQLDDEGKRLLGVVRSNARRMGQLIDDLLRFLRLARQGMDLAEVAVTPMAQAVFDEVLQAIPGRSVELALGPLPAAWADPSMLRQVLTNLVSNAVKFTERNERALVEIGGESRDTECAYWVRDNGVGFDMRYVDKMFGVFQRLHSVEEFQGTGVGLAIVERIVRRHGGRVWAEGRVGEGATVGFSLPKRRRG